MFERIFGKRKSLQRNLVIDLIICIIIVMFISLVGFYIFVNKETLNSLIQVNFENKEQIKEILGITRRSLVLLIINTILISTIVIFLITSVVAVLFGFLTTAKINLVNPENTEAIKEVFDNTVEEGVELNILERTVSVLSTNSFVNLLSTSNLVALIVMSVLFGIAINKAGEKGKKVAELFDSFSEIMYKLIEIIMYYAPIGLGCYFASLVGTLGGTIAVGFLKTFVVYTLVCLVFMAVFYSLYAFIAGGFTAVKAFWSNIIPSALTSIGTCSSAASVPVNIECTKKMGVPNDIAETTVSLGTSFHKDGSCIGSVFKIMFLVSLFGTSLSTFGDVSKVLGIALLATLLVTAVPIGGGTISEMLILTMMNYNVAALPILTIVATIIDAPATLLNVVGDSASAMMVTRVVEGKDWINKKNNKKEK